MAESSGKKNKFLGLAMAGLSDIIPSLTVAEILLFATLAGDLLDSVK